jgi:RNA recognition motif-containing protein
MGGGGAGPAPPDRTLYVGNLPYDCSVLELETLINGVAAGQVVRVHLPMDPDGRKRGFGFVTMASAEGAKAASEALKTADLRGRRLVINLAHPKGDRPARPDGGFGGGGFAGGGGGGGFGGPPPGAFSGGAPPPQRKTFDDRRRRHTNNNEDGPRKRRFERDDRGGGADDDWKAGGGTSGDDD